jgi:hypothetical protein
MKLKFWKKETRIDPNKVLMMIRREEPEPHYELHFDKRVEFWTLDGRKLGQSKVEVVSYYGE